MHELRNLAFESPIGPLTAEAGFVDGCARLVSLRFGGSLDSRAQGESRLATILDAAREQLMEYFAAQRTTFDLPLHLVGTEFQTRVWEVLARIPFGQTRSYADVARAIESPGAVRAVGAANARNPIAIIVPCHRVINSSGQLHGYAGGLERKARLLELEGAVPALFA